MSRTNSSAHRCIGKSKLLLMRPRISTPTLNPKYQREMKTPMQELIEQMWEIAKYGDSYEVAPCIEAAEAMLEKEKEVMESAWQDGMYECDGDGTFEDFYKTFNSKEK